MEQIADPKVVNAPAMENPIRRLKEIIAKGPDGLTDEELHILIGRVGYLSDDERARFSPVLKRSALTEQERWRYEHLGLLKQYFPEGE